MRIFVTEPYVRSDLNLFAQNKFVMKAINDKSSVIKTTHSGAYDYLNRSTCPVKDKLAIDVKIYLILEERQFFTNKVIY